MLMYVCVCVCVCVCVYVCVRVYVCVWAWDGQHGGGPCARWAGRRRAIRSSGAMSISTLVLLNGIVLSMVKSSSVLSTLIYHFVVQECAFRVGSAPRELPWHPFSLKITLAPRKPSFFLGDEPPYGAAKSSFWPI